LLFQKLSEFRELDRRKFQELAPVATLQRMGTPEARGAGGDEKVCGRLLV
jgi:hypothetical protein